MLADDAAARQGRGLGWVAVGERRRVGSVVEDRADVIRHAAVDRHVAAHSPVFQGNVLDDAHAVEHDHRGTGDRTARLNGHVRDGQAVVGAALAHDSRQGTGDLDRRGRLRILARVGDTDATAQVDRGNVEIQLGLEERRKVDDDARGLGEGLGPKNLGADVAVQAPEVQVGRVLDRGHGLVGLAGGQGQAELLVLVGGRDVLVAARVDAGLQAHHDGRNHAESGGDALDLVDLVHRVDEDAVNTGLQGEADLRVRLVVAVQTDPRRIHPGAQCEGQLAERGSVDAQPLGRDEARDVGAQERLAGVEGVAAVHAVAVPELLGHRRSPHAGAPAHGLDVEHEGGRATIGGHRRQVNAAHAQHATLPARTPRPQVGALVGGRAGQELRLAHRVTSSRGRSRQGGRGRCAAPG